MDQTVSLERTSELLGIDAGNMLQSLRDVPDQLMSGWGSMAQVTLPTHYIQATNVFILGAGASGLAGEYAKRLAAQSSSVPVEVGRSAVLPAYVNGRTLVIAISYSGQTAETVAGFREAAERGCKLFAITTGGEIGALCRKYRAPWYQIQYGSTPRAAFGYLVAPLVEALQRLGFLDKHAVRFEPSVAAVRQYAERLETPVPAGQNPAKSLAQKLSGRQLFMVASDTCLPVAVRWTMQLAQNAKHMAWAEPLDTVQHATVERLGAFGGAGSGIYTLNFRSSHDTEADALALNGIEQLLALAKLPGEELLLDGDGTLLQDLLAYTLLGDYVSFYLALAKQTDPSPTPHRDELAERMGGGRIYQATR